MHRLGPRGAAIAAFLEEVRSKFGTHAPVVEAFLAEVTSIDVDWEALALAARTPGRRAALSALAEVPFPVAMLSAVERAALDAYGSLGLTDDDFENPLSRGTVKVAIVSGAQALAVQDKLAHEHLEALLAPLAHVGVASVEPALASS